ncbi:MAG TPA: DUF5677 domain-containing protein [Vicinamibacterales bacterium]|nr:DUF5677 domain-containing protein [Vicinamibacterales bacterium]
MIDAVMLEKLKQQRASDYAGLGLIPDGPTLDDFAAIEARLNSRYPEEALQAMRRHGFSGVNIEARAKRVGRGDLYNIMYRNFSRNVHGGDFTELVLANEPSLIGRERYEAYIESRDSIAVELAFGSLGAVLVGTNGILRLGFDQRCAELAAKRERTREAQKGREV